MKHTKRTRAETIAEQSSNQTEKQAASTADKPLTPVQAVIAFGRQAERIGRNIEEAIAASESDGEKERLANLNQQILRLLEVSTHFYAFGSPGVGARFKASTAAHDELSRACHEAVDMLYLMAVPLSGYMEQTAAEGNGVQGIAYNMGKRLIECADAACEENLMSGGAR